MDQQNLEAQCSEFHRMFCSGSQIVSKLKSILSNYKCSRKLELRKVYFNGLVNMNRSGIYCQIHMNHTTDDHSIYNILFVNSSFSLLQNYRLEYSFGTVKYNQIYIVNQVCS